MKISTERPSDRSDAKISRENVANTLVHIATKTFSDNKVFELFDGDKSISVL